MFLTSVLNIILDLHLHQLPENHRIRKPTVVVVANQKIRSNTSFPHTHVGIPNYIVQITSKRSNKNRKLTINLFWPKHSSELVNRSRFKHKQNINVHNKGHIFTFCIIRTQVWMHANYSNLKVHIKTTRHELQTTQSQ